MARCPHPGLPSYDDNPILIGRPNEYARYAAHLDEWHPGWQDDNYPNMVQELREEADRRRRDVEDLKRAFG